MIAPGLVAMVLVPAKVGLVIGQMVCWERMARFYTGNFEGPPIPIHKWLVAAAFLAFLSYLQLKYQPDHHRPMPVQPAAEDLEPLTAMPKGFISGASEPETLEPNRSNRLR